MMKFALICVFVLLVVLPAILCGGEGKRRKEGGPADFDYEIYELIDRLNKLKPEHSTLYDLLEVSPSASSEEISRKFRRLSFPYHPDKTQGDLEAKKMFTLYSGAAQVLKVAESRKRYEWILHEAPPWHRSQVFLVRKLRKKRRTPNGTGNKEISIVGLVSFLIGSLTLAQLLIQWTRFAINRYWIWSGKRALNAIPAQELRRMEKKALRSDLTFLANVDTNFESLQASRAEKLSVPQPSDLFVVRVPLALLRLLFSPFLRLVTAKKVGDEEKPCQKQKYS
jgi:curved DNA-binding protein CbpA